jgi:ribonuclease D
LTPSPLPHRYIETTEELAELGEILRGASCIGMDTESDSMHSYFEKVCLIQFVLPGERVFVVDSIRLRNMAPLAPALEDPSIRKILHGSDYDIVCIKRDFQISLRGTFDTMTGALLLGLEKIGLGDLVRAHFDVDLAKAFTRSDWSTRPLSAGQVEYLVQDVQYLLPLAEAIENRLREADLMQEAFMEFERLEERAPTPREIDPWAFLRIRGAKELPERGRAVLRELVILREEKSREIDRPTFKVLANETLIRLAQAQPDSMGRLRAVKGVTPYLLRRYGDELVEAVRRGLESPEGVPDRAPPKPGGGDPSLRMGVSAQRRLGRLKEWRKVAAEKAGRTTLAVLPNHAMFEVARLMPTDLEALAACGGVGSHRAAVYGEEILTLLHGSKRNAPK